VSKIRDFILWHILEISGVGAILAIIGLAVTIAVDPVQTGVIGIITAACGWAIGVFHGVQATMRRDDMERSKYEDGDE
jgi:O-antigen ligase